MKKILLSFAVAMAAVGNVLLIGSYGAVEAKEIQGKVQTKEQRKVQVSDTTEEMQEQTKKFIQDLGSTAIGTINRPKVSSEEVQQVFRSLLKENFALERIARYSLGKNFRVLSEEEKKDFLECFEKMIVRLYSSRFSEYKSAKLIVTGARKKSSKQVIVDSKIVRQNKEDIVVSWSVYATNKGLKVYDVIISDVSISNVQRSEFMSKISEKGLKKFLADFREKYKK